MNSFVAEIPARANPSTVSLLDAIDWGGTALGVPSGWPAELKTLARLMLSSESPQHIVWGPDQILLYNDGYISLLGDRHPAAFGSRFRDVWPDVWDGLEPIVRQTYAGVASSYQDHPWLLDRGDHREQVWISFAYTPIHSDGIVAGLHCTFHETTASVLAEKTRSQELDKLRRMFEQAPGFIALLDGPEHVFTLTNDAYGRLVGGRDVVGKAVAQALPEAVDQGFIALLDKVYCTGERFVGARVPWEIETAGGQRERHYVDFIYQPVVDASGAVTGIFVEGSDVTEHVRAEDELRAVTEGLAAAAAAAELERSRLDALLQAAPVGIGYAAIDGELLMVNQANRDLWGPWPMSRTVDDYGVWRGWWADHSARHGQPLAPADWGLARALQGEDVPGDLIEIEPFDAPGSRKTILLRATPVRGPNGTLAGAVVAQVDLTDRIEAEARLRESEARFRTITDAMPQMVWSTRPDGYADYFNHQWYEFTGLAPGDCNGDGWTRALHPDDRAPAAASWHRSANTGALYEIEYRMRDRAGDYRWVLGRGLPVCDENGQIIRWMGTCTDIHEQKLAQSALEESAAALRLADRRKDEFLAMLAHELRNPLAPIRTAADVVAMPDAPVEVTRRAAQVITRQAAHMTELIDDLLDVSRVTRGLIELDRSVFDLREAVHAAVEQARPAVDARSHSLAIRSVAAPVWVDGEATRITQVIANLLNNAAKYTPDGGDIRVDVRLSGERVRVDVGDNGSGIAPDLLPHVFELFTQGSRSLDRSQGGLGIGLALVRGLVELHGGSVDAKSDGVGHGSCFSFDLPLVSRADADVSGAQALAQHREQASGLGMVVVDDNQDAAGTIAMLLEAAGNRVCAYHTGTEALAGSESGTVDAYVLDIGLPDMTGHELARRIRARPGDAGAILLALSGYGRDEDREASLAAGFDAHLVKPVDGEALLVALEEARRRKRGGS